MRIKLYLLSLLSLIITSSGCNQTVLEPDPVRASLSQSETQSNPEMIPLVNTIQNAAESYRALSEGGDSQIPEDLADKAKCIAVIPNMIKAAFIVGGHHGEGIAVCRDVFGNWSPPSFITLTGGSLGWQIGAQSTDVVLYFMDEKSAQSLLEQNATLGADASIAAGPAGRSARVGTDIKLTGIVSYARSEGFFAGVSLEGASLRPNDRANTVFYGKVLTSRDILFSSAIESMPPVANRLIEQLPRKGV